jgi:hypothetical protein
MGLVLTSAAQLNSSADEIKKVARVRKPADPQSVIKQLIATTGMAALASAVMTFSEPPGIAVASAVSGLLATVIAIIWSGSFSVAFAFFAATARAALMCQSFSRS